MEEVYYLTKFRMRFFGVFALVLLLLPFFYSWSFFVGFLNRINLPSSVLSITSTFKFFPNIGIQQTLLFILMFLISFLINTKKPSKINRIELPFFVIVNTIIFLLNYNQSNNQLLYVYFGLSCFFLPFYLGTIFKRIFEFEKDIKILFLLFLLVLITSVYFGYSYRAIDGNRKADLILSEKPISRNIVTNFLNGISNSQVVNSVNSVIKESDFPIINFSVNNNNLVSNNEKNVTYESTLKNKYYCVLILSDDIYILHVNPILPNKFRTLKYNKNQVKEIEFINRTELR